jgi:hypothetical protein
MHQWEMVILFYNLIGQASIIGRLGIIQQTTSCLFVGLLNCISVFPVERIILLNEYADKAYSVEAFFLAYNLIEIPVEIISAFGYTGFAMAIDGINTYAASFLCMSVFP